VNTRTKVATRLAKGADFYSFPAFSPNGERIAWIQWHHPNMPWEASELFFANITASEEGILIEGVAKRVAGEGEQSISQPLWASNGTLVFTSDISGFNNPWVYDVSKASSRPILATPEPYDYNEPAWSLGDYRLAVLTESHILVTPLVNSKPAFATLNIDTGKSTPLKTPYVTISRLRRVNASEVVFIGLKDDAASALILMKIDIAYETSFTILKETSDLASRFPSALISPETSISLPNPDDAHPLHVLLALPRNPEYDPAGNGEEKPPCVLMAHGGPTARAAPGLSWMTQFFTSRGWALLVILSYTPSFTELTHGLNFSCSVNYGGSSGYGTDYRNRLRGNWGLVDPADCATAVRILGEQGLIDPKRVAIKGRSAGGYTVLQALVKYPTVWAAGASSFGISDLIALMGDTHKFERYVGMMSRIHG
jgi:dipeptidyl aminopeptidase/acylaminoacyl peptidase